MIVVTGAGGSLGPHVARRLAQAGEQLALVDTDPSRLEGLPGSAHAVDLLDEEATRAFAASLDGVTGVAHLVGGWRGGKPLGEAPLEDWSLLHKLLIQTVQHTSRAFLPALHAAGDRGRFVLISAKAAQHPTSDNAAYGAAKAAAEAWTLALADELRASGGTANIVVINALVTPQMRDENPGKEYATFTDADEIADAIAFLMSPSARKMNGKRLALHP